MRKGSMIVFMRASFCPDHELENRGDAPRLPAPWPAALSALIALMIGGNPHANKPGLAIKEGKTIYKAH
jgi:hypothetical protein